MLRLVLVNCRLCYFEGAILKRPLVTVSG